MSKRIKNKKLNILWPISILKFSLTFMSYTIFSQSFITLLKIFCCKNRVSLVDSSLICPKGFWLYFVSAITLIGIIFQIIIGLITSALYFKPIFIISGSDVLKKTNSFPDIIFIITKIGVNLLFFFDKETESEHWIIIFFLILFTGMNAYYNFYFKNRFNKTLIILNKIFCLITFSGYFALFIGNFFKGLGFTGTIHLFLISIIIIIIYIFIYQNNQINYIIIDYSEINNPFDYSYYISIFYKIIKNRNNSRDYYTILESLISKIEQNCIIPECPIKKYMENIKNGIDCPFLLNQYCEKLFEYGISKFSDDVSLKNYYSIFLIMDMNYKKKALMILNSIQKKALSFLDNYNIFRTLRLIEKTKSSILNKKNSAFEYRQKSQEFKDLIKKLINLYNEFISLLLDSKLQNIDNFNKIHKIGSQIMKLNPKIEEKYNNLTNIKTDNIEIIKLYSEFVEGVLRDEEKLEKCKNIAKLKYSTEFKTYEKDFSNLDIKVLSEKINLPYLIVSTHKEQIGKIIDVSLNILKIFGYTKSELIGKNINMLIPKILAKNHDSLIREQYEKDKLRLLENLNSKKLYFPEIVKKDVFGVTKLKFLINLKMKIYFIKTEDNILLYVAEIENYLPLINLIKNVNSEAKLCILTDQNLIIQNFTPNCLEHLKLNVEYINSNINIVNYIKQFQDDDYLTSFNKSSIMQNNSYINKNITVMEDKPQEQRNSKVSLISYTKNKNMNDQFFKKFSKKCKITWCFYDEINCEKSEHNSSSESDNYSNNNKEIDLYMEIEKLMVKQELKGYYFYFTKLNKNNYQNINYTMEKSLDNSGNNLIKVKKYRCLFDSNEAKNNNNATILRNKINQNQMFQSLIMYPSNIRINNFRKKERKKSIEKNSKVSFKEEEDYLLNNYSTLKANNWDTKIDDNSNVITGDFVPNFTIHFSINLKNLTFVKVKENEQSINYVEILKKEANNKIRILQEKLKYLTKKTKSNKYTYDSEEYESDELSEVNSSELKKSSSNSDSHSLIDNDNKEKDGNDIIDELAKNKTEQVLKEEEKNNNQNNNENNNYNLNEDNSNSIKMLKRYNFINNYHKVNLSKIRLYVFDFYKEQVVIGNKNDVVSKVESITNKIGSHGPLDLEKDDIFFGLLTFNEKKKKNKNKDGAKGNETIKDKFDENTKKIDEEKLFEKKISQALKKQKNELPIIRLKILIILAFISIVTFGIIFIYYDGYYLKIMSMTIDIVKNIIFVKYNSYLSIYYLRELSLMHFEESEIKGGEYTNFPDTDKDNYVNNIKDELMQLFIENQSQLKAIYSTSLVLSNSSQTYLSKTKLKIKVSRYPNFDMSSVILVCLMQYSGALNNLASSPTKISQSHPDLILFLYNSLNQYRLGISALINLYSLELENILRTVKMFVKINITIIFFWMLIIYTLLIINFFQAIKRRGNYMKVFYGINESTLKILIYNCENLLNRLKSSEEQKFHEEQTIYQSLGDRLSIENNQKINKIQKNVNQQNPNLISDNGNENENQMSNKASSYSIIFIIIYGLFTLLYYVYFIFNGFYLINSSKKSILISNLFYKVQNFQLGIIDMFNTFREFIFDNQSIINGTSPVKYMANSEKKIIPSILEDIKYLSINFEEKFSINESSKMEENLCSYYINEYFDSTFECSDRIGLISGYNFFFLSYYFLQEIFINKNIMIYKLKHENIVGNLTDYNHTKYMNDAKIPKANDNSGNNNIFRLDLFNNYTIHARLNVIFYSIILPYISKGKKTTFFNLSLDSAINILTKLNISFLGIVTLVFFFYFIPMINFINNIIYKTKNLLSIIPLNILATQNGVSSLLNLS